MQPFVAYATKGCRCHAVVERGEIREAERPPGAGPERKLERHTILLRRHWRIWPVRQYFRLGHPTRDAGSKPHRYFLEPRYSKLSGRASRQRPLDLGRRDRLGGLDAAMASRPMSAR